MSMSIKERIALLNKKSSEGSGSDSSRSNSRTPVGRAGGGVRDRIAAMQKSKSEGTPPSPQVRKAFTPPVPSSFAKKSPVVSTPKAAEPLAKAAEPLAKAAEPLARAAKPLGRAAPKFVVEETASSTSTPVANTDDSEKKELTPFQKRMAAFQNNNSASSLAAVGSGGKGSPRFGSGKKSSRRVTELAGKLKFPGGSPPMFGGTPPNRRTKSDVGPRSTPPSSASTPSGGVANATIDAGAANTGAGGLKHLSRPTIPKGRRRAKRGKTIASKLESIKLGEQ